MELPSTIRTAEQAAVVLAPLWAALAADAIPGAPGTEGANLTWQSYTGPVVVRLLAATSPLPPVLWLADRLEVGAFVDAWAPPTQQQRNPDAVYRLVSAHPLTAGRGCVALSDPSAPMEYLPWTLQLVTNVALTCAYQSMQLREFADQPGQPKRSLLREAADLDALAVAAAARIPDIYAGWRDTYAAALPSPDVSQKTAAFTTHPISLSR